MSTPLYILQQSQNDDQYILLQQKALEELQKLCGNIWTDYNPHDPGVTILETANYALTELHYRFSFALQDYLTGKEQRFRPETFGLFLPEKIFPASPVTVDDYRKLLLARIPELDNVWTEFDREKGIYNFRLYVSPSCASSAAEEIKQKVKKLFLSCRNLCEQLGNIDFPARERLCLYAGISLSPEVDPTLVLSEIYRTANHYLAGNLQIQMPEDMLSGNIPPDQWLDGPTDNGVRINLIPQAAAGTETEFHELLLKIKGIRSVDSCYFKDKQGKTINRFEKPYIVHIPANPDELHIQIHVEGTTTRIHPSFFHPETRARLISLRDGRIQGQNETFPSSLPEGRHYPFNEYYSITEDLPRYYGVGRCGLSGKASRQRQAQANQLKAYLTLFDLALARGNSELGNLFSILSMNEETNRQILNPETLEHIDRNLLDGDIENSASFLHPKEQLLDMWDRLYGTDSNPAWLCAWNYYDDSPETRIKQRVNFLRKIPQLGKDRFKACNVLEAQNAVNIPGIKEYVSTLLGWQQDEGSSVGNILPSWNLQLVPDNDYEEHFSHFSNPELIQEQMLHRRNIYPVTADAAPCTDGDYEEMRRSLPVFSNNVMSEELFREGIRLENYKLVRTSPHGPEYLLLFRNRKKISWTPLGRSVKREHLHRMANILHQFLVKLNRESETMYVVEHTWFTPPETYKVSFVFSGWSARMNDPRFREICRQLTISRLPAHITADFYWLNADEMQHFESVWRKWRKHMMTGSEASASKTAGELYDIFTASRQAPQQKQP